MKNRLLATLMVVLMLAVVSCKKKTEDGASQLPPNNLNDTEKIDFMIEHGCTPDSLARYICCTFLGKNPGNTLNSMEATVNYARSKYLSDPNSLTQFDREFDSYANSLPLAERMQILRHAAVTDAEKLGYMLGVDYASDILQQRKTLGDVDRELAQLKVACGTDTLLYLRVLVGLSTAIIQPEYQGLPEAVRKKYGTAPDIKHPELHTYSETPAKENVEAEKSTDQPAEAEKENTDNTPKEENKD